MLRQCSWRDQMRVRVRQSKPSKLMDELALVHYEQG